MSVSSYSTTAASAGPGFPEEGSYWDRQGVMVGPAVLQALPDSRCAQSGFLTPGDMGWVFPSAVIRTLLPLFLACSVTVAHRQFSGLYGPL
jgi:hypothetical protein